MRNPPFLAYAFQRLTAELILSLHLVEEKLKTESRKQKSGRLLTKG